MDERMLLRVINRLRYAKTPNNSTPRRTMNDWNLAIKYTKLGRRVRKIGNDASQPENVKRALKNPTHKLSPEEKIKVLKLQSKHIMKHW